jgi:hypothetical protein
VHSDNHWVRGGSGHVTCVLIQMHNQPEAILVGSAANKARSFKPPSSQHPSVTAQLVSLAKLG